MAIRKKSENIIKEQAPVDYVPNAEGEDPD